MSQLQHSPHLCTKVQRIEERRGEERRGKGVQEEGKRD
jgi:hypothetical protein